MESNLEVDEILRSELTTINEESETCDMNHGPKVVKKTMKEDVGRVFTAQFSLKKSYALFFDRMTSSRSFGAIQVY